jgi:hypothetical protein
MSQQKKFETEPAVTVAADQVTQSANSQKPGFAEGLAQGLAQAAQAGATKAELNAVAEGLSVTNAQLKAISPSLAATLRSEGFYAEAEALGGKPAPKTFMEKVSAKADETVKVKHVGYAIAGTAVAVVGYDLIAREMDWKRPGLFAEKPVDVPAIEAPSKKR